MKLHSNYDKRPFVQVSDSCSHCLTGWKDIAARLRAAVSGSGVICVECYPGAWVPEIKEALSAGMCATRVFDASECLKTPDEIERMLERNLTGDRVFGRMNDMRVNDFLDEHKAAEARLEIGRRSNGLTLVVGTGASLLAPRADLLVYADMARWEIQMRQRRGQIGNLGAQNETELPGLKYKRAFFVDWRAADRLKKEVLPRIDFLLDTNSPHNPKLTTRESLFRGLEAAASRPFRLVPFFDPGPWGGQWMREVCDLPGEAPNYAWCFDCVPEENSLLLGFGGTLVEIPSIDLVFFQPRQLLGDAVHARFGTEFPIRFDFLDTMGGGNLSLQVHPLTEYIQDQFGMNYTQDESYYMLDAGEDGEVFLGLKEGTVPDAMVADLRRAQEEGGCFPAEKYVNAWPARKHDHFLIPAGTVHCSGRNGMVLEISSTPYIFTFKLWDWGRMGMDGRPRPIHLEHGARNIQWDRTTEWVRRNLVNQVTPVASGDGWREERTGLHAREFIETRRHWFRGAVPHDTRGGANVLNLVEGEEATVESPAGAFEPLVVHYAETFVVPAAVGPYAIRPSGPAEGQECATIKAFVRTNA